MSSKEFQIYSTVTNKEESKESVKQKKIASIKHFTNLLY